MKKQRKKLKVRRLGLQTKLNVMLVLFALLLGIATFASFAFAFSDAAVNLFWEKAQGAAYIVANYLNQSEIETSIRQMEQDDAYEHALQRIVMFREALNVHDFLVLIPGQTSATVFMAVQDDEDAPMEFGNVILYSAEDYEYLLPCVEQGVASNEITFSDTHGQQNGGAEVCAWAPVKDSSGKLIAIVEADIQLNRAVHIVADYAGLVISVYLTTVLVCVLLQMLVTRQLIVSPLKRITSRAADFASGNQLTGFKDDIHSGDELQVLNEALNKMAGDISAYTDRKARIAADGERAATELNVAAQMQKGMIPPLPEEFMRQHDLWLEGRLVTSPEVEGESYDYFVLDDSRLAVVMCSMKTSGLSASVQLLVARTIIRSQLLSGRSFAEAMSNINRQLFEQLPQHDIPLRAFVGVLDSSTHRLTYINADQNAPILMCRGQSYNFLPCPAYAPLGQVENVSYQERTVELGQGDRLLWYSDGLLDVPDENGEPMGVDGLKSLLNADRTRTPEGLMALLETLGGGENGADARALVLLECRQVNQKRSQLRVEPRVENAEQVRSFVRKRLESQPLSGRDRAQLLVCAEEYFSVCCRYVKRGMVEISCVPEARKFILRFAADLNGLDPFEHDAGETMENTVAFIRKYTDDASARVVNGCTILTMSKDLMGQATEE